MILSDTPVLRVLVAAWLIVLSVYDWRFRRLPHSLTTIPLVAIGGIAFVRTTVTGLRTGILGAVDPLVVLLSFLAVLVSDSWAALVPAAGALGLAFWLRSPAGQVVAVGWSVILALAKAGIIGEGDAKAVMILLVLYPDVRLVLAICAAVFVFGLAVLVRRMGKAAPFLLFNVLREARAGLFPAQTGGGTIAAPLIPVVALGALAYLFVV